MCSRKTRTSTQTSSGAKGRTASIHGPRRRGQPEHSHRGHPVPGPGNVAAKRCSMSMTSAQYAVAVGTATPEQRKIAKKQRRFIVVETPYYPTVEDMMEAVAWLANRGFGKAPQIVPIESDQTTGFRFEFRPWPPGMDPASQRVIDEKTKAG